MFILKKEATFTHPIVFFTPDDGGTQKKETFDAVFKIIPQSRINEIRESADKKQKELDVQLIFVNLDTREIYDAMPRKKDKQVKVETKNVINIKEYMQTHMPE